VDPRLRSLHALLSAMSAFLHPLAPSQAHCARMLDGGWGRAHSVDMDTVYRLHLGEILLLYRCDGLSNAMEHGRHGQRDAFDGDLRLFVIHIVFKHRLRNYNSWLAICAIPITGIFHINIMWRI